MTEVSPIDTDDRLTHDASLLYATHEIEVLEEDEGDLQKHYLNCSKNPGHKNFIPINEFTITHLPPGYQDQDIFELIKATADLTIRVNVKKTSKNRPEFSPNTKEPYAFYNMRGSDVMRIGTGIMCHVYKYTAEYINKFKKGTCKCKKCQNSNAPSEAWGKVIMYTGTHVVFDDLEATHTTCRLFFDSQDSPLVTLDRWTVEDANITDDRCKVACVTCDMDLLDKLDDVYKKWHWYDLRCKVNRKYKSSRDTHKLTFIVSHPHGCPKHVSVGFWIDRYIIENSGMTRYTYTTSTCPGSSGAHVHALGYREVWLYYEYHVHSGVNSEGKNISGAGEDFGT